MHVRFRLSLLFLFGALPYFGINAAPAPAHDQFRVAVYIPVGVVQKMKDPVYLEKTWRDLSSQVAVEKVYIETYRSGTMADDGLLETVKKFFATQGVQTAGGIAYVGAGDTAGSDAEDESEGQFVSMCYTNPKERAYVKEIAELTTRHFD